jgi:hypothetical protein
LKVLSQASVIHAAKNLAALRIGLSASTDTTVLGLGISVRKAHCRSSLRGKPPQAAQ